MSGETTSTEESQDELTDQKHPPAWIALVGGLVAVPLGLWMASWNDWEIDRIYLVPIGGILLAGWGIRQRMKAGSWTSRTYMTEEQVERGKNIQKSYHRSQLMRLGGLGVIAVGGGIYYLVAGSDGGDALAILAIGLAALVVGGLLWVWQHRRNRV